MTWLTWLFFESLPALAGVLGLVLFVLLVHWRRGGRWSPLAIGAAVAVLLLVVQALVVTPREQAARILGRIERDLLAGRATALKANLAPNFDWGRPGDDFGAFVERQLQRVRIHWLQRWELRVRESEPDRFVVVASYLADITAESFATTMRSSWALTFVRVGGEWKIAKIEPLQLGDSTHPGWGDVDRH
jgi:hypothetical protein